MGLFVSDTSFSYPANESNKCSQNQANTTKYATVDLVPYTKHTELMRAFNVHFQGFTRITLAPSRTRTHPFPTPLHPIPKSITINKIRGYSKVSNQGNQCCFQTCTVHEQRAGLIFVCGLITCFCILMEGGDCALSPISEDKGLANYFVWMLMIGFH